MAESGSPAARATLADVEAAARRLRAAAPGLRARPQREIIESLGRVGARFADEGDEMRRRALAELPAAAHLSPEMARAVLDGMARDWSVDRLQALVDEELPGGVLDGLEMRGDGEATGRAVMAVGPALCVQIVSGSVPGVGVHALLRSLLVKAPTLIKPGRGDALLPALFAEALGEEDPELAHVLEVLYWPGGLEEVERAVLNEADVAVLYGSDETVEELRALAPATTRVVAYHHRVGLGIVGREGLAEADDARRVAADVARAVAIFEQRGCVCPQRVYVEEGGAVSPADFAGLVAEALAGLEAELPSPAPSMDEAGLLAQLRGTAEMHAAAGAVELYHGGAEASWTVIYEAEPVGGLSGGGRTARVRPVPDARELASELAPPGRDPRSVGPHLQSVGYAGLGSRLGEVAEALGRAGASRVVPFPALAFPPPWWLHDGQGPLRVLVRWVEVERG